ncbi:hypothetical protein [Sphingomonas soli]|uniref:hypothetical protein n=1 Tax=Sphingomonas soli TaxID=266127 RepID=UPI0012EDEC03|nr:hypothetical protein [Sphingomonas soli]
MQEPTQQTPPPVILGPPAEIDAATLAFCAAISPHAPIYVPVDPQPHAKVAYCFDNSVRQAGMQGGEAAYGWAIWRWPGRWFEAEHHAVWRHPDGSLLDVTPQLGDPERILFLPDPEKVYDPSTYRRNVIAPDADNALAAEYIELVRQRTDITDRYWYPGVEVLPLFSAEDQARLAPIDARMSELRAALVGDPSAPFVAEISEPGHPLHAAWRELNRSVDAHPSRGLVRDNEVRKLLTLLRRDHPVLAARLDPQRIALWEPPVSCGTRWLLLGLALLLSACILYLVYGRATRPPPQPVVVVTPEPLTNQRVDIDRALEEIFGEQLSIADIERNPSLLRLLESVWNNAREDGTPESFAAEVSAVLKEHYRANMSTASAEDLLAYHRLMLENARALRGLSVEDCAAFASGKEFDASLMPADLAQREIALAARILPNAQRQAGSQTDFVMPAAISAEVIRRAKLTPTDLAQALAGKGTPERVCGARIALWETLLDLPASRSVPLLRKF